MRKLMNFKIVVAVLLCLLICSISAEAQKRRTTSTRKTTAARKTATPSVAKLAARNAAILPATEKVANQIKNLAQFILLMGNTLPVIERVEAGGANAGSAKSSQSARVQAETAKKGLVSAITIFKNAMADLEDQFRGDPVLRPYFSQLNGVSENAATAEQQAAAGNFNQAGRALLLVVNQLTDVLREMP